MAAELTKEYFKECFCVKSNELYWRKDRPVEHFESPKRYKRWYREFAGKQAGTVYSGIRRLQLQGQNIRADRVVDILTENVEMKVMITFNDVFRIMTNETHRRRAPKIADSMG